MDKRNIMDKRSTQARDGWSTSAASLADGAVLYDPRLIPEVPPDGRDLPDVELDGLVEVILARLAGYGLGKGAPSSGERR